MTAAVVQSCGDDVAVGAERRSVLCQNFTVTGKPLP